MPVTIEERPLSRPFALKARTETREYVVNGEFDDTSVKVYALANTPLIISTPVGILYRQDLQAKPAGYKTWYITVFYARGGSVKIDFDTTGGTVRIFQAKEHVQSYPAGENPPDHKGAINVNQGRVEGADVVIPALKLNVAFTHAMAVLSIAQIKTIARTTGTVNLNPFLGFAGGELLLLGATGSEGSESETEATYSFAASENVEGLTFGDVAGVSKRGHDLLWIEYKDAVSNDKPARQAEFVHVERTYEETDFASRLGWSL